MLAIVLLAQLSAPTPVSGQRSLADVARERSLRTGSAAGTRPTPIVLELATPAPIPTSAMRRAGDLGPDYDAPSLPTTNSAAFRETAAARAPVYEPGPAPTAVESSRLADKIGFGFAAAGGVIAAFGGIFLIAVWLLSPLLGLRIGRTKGYPDWAGALAGLLLGPFVLFMTFITRSMKRCPFCLSNIPIEAKVCARCQREQPKKTTP
jgi:hypothetical protein